MANHGPTLTAGRFPRVVTVVKRGGPGSGHFGHAGRPGLMGGSLPSDMHFGVPQGKRIVKVLSVIDTREYEDIDDKWVPIAGSGKANVCERCGKLHEVHATVELEDGTEALMGTSCARAEFSEAARKQMGRKENAAKRLKALETKADAIHTAQKVWDEEYGRVQGEGHPDPFITYERDRMVVKVGEDGWAQGFLTDTAGVDPRSEANKKRVVDIAIGTYWHKRMAERGHGASRPVFDKYEHDKAVRRLRKVLDEAEPVDVVERGGEGSGHFGHEGRPGEVGGSAPSPGGPAEEKPAASAKGEAPSGEAPKGAPAKTGMFPAGAEPAKGDDERTRADKLDILRYAAWDNLPKELQDEVMRLQGQMEYEIPRDQSQAVAQFSVLHGALVKNLVSKGISEQDAATKATEILKKNMPELTTFAIESVKSWKKAEANIQTSHAKAKELGYENYYTNAYTGEPISISNPKDELFTGKDKALFNLKLFGTMNAEHITDPNDMTLGQIRQTFAGTILEDRINSLYPAAQSGKKLGEYAAEEEKPKVEKKSVVERGGLGSGHFDHRGRPGERGGSLPSGGGASILNRKAEMDRNWKGDGYSVKFIDDKGEKVGGGWYRTLEAAQKDMDEWMATGRIVPKPGDFHFAEMPAYSILREPDNYWGAPRGFRIGEKEYALDELGKMFADQPNMPEADRELAIRQVAKEPTKKAIGEILQWSTSRYNEMSKAKAVDYARGILDEGKEIAVLSAGSYTPSTAMTGSDYVVHGPQSYIAVGVGGTSQWRGEKAMEGFREQKRYYFGQGKPSVSKSFVARFTRRLKND